MPHLVQMQKKYGKQGLATLALHVGYVEELNKDLKSKVAKILADKGVTAPSLILNEPDELWQKKLTDSYPCVFVFDKDGKWTKFGEIKDLSVIDKLAEKLLKK